MTVIDIMASTRVSEGMRWRIVALREDAKWSYGEIARHLVFRDLLSEIKLCDLMKQSAFKTGHDRAARL